MFSLNSDTGDIMYKKFTIPENHSISAFYSFFEAIYDTNYRTDGEIHNFWEIVCVIDGRLGVTADKDVYILEDGQAIIHKPMEFHNVWSENSCPKIIILTFEGTLPKLNKRIFKMSEHTKNAIRSLSSDALKIFDFDDDIGIFITGIKKGQEVLAEKFLKKCELFILSLLSEVDESPTQIAEGSAKSYMNIASFLSENIDKNLCIYDISKALNMSESNIKKIFKKYSGLGIINYFNTIKIKKAQSLLKGGMSVREAAEKVGFSDQNYFSTVFKRITGVSPKNYKTNL